jgi:hypothetical protein
MLVVKKNLMTTLIDWLVKPLSYPFMQRALIAGLAVAAVCAVIGVFIVQRGLAFLGDGLAHAAFGGIAIGLYMGASVEHAVWIAIPFTAAIALGIGFVLRRTTLRGDVATGVFFSFSFALGVLFLGLRKASDRQIDVESLLFGNMLAVAPEVLHAEIIQLADRDEEIAVLARTVARPADFDGTWIHAPAGAAAYAHDLYANLRTLERLLGAPPLALIPTLGAHPEPGSLVGHFGQGTACELLTQRLVEGRKT